ncbi:hypothetical protein RB623_09970 [Mesorhizobium sp. LHD-90]|uniref:hypothetical protein n=1 Tax=Mesorhizobium sp. LHD-90 TaxID=3071414 RepID=UPI0027E01497|nr:hypothetical protein [Mesorhizobium sp. LHD-90]MDQ6434374.1 hypothetical protein [Mesorhizobium sp. LHD-90]
MNAVDFFPFAPPPAPAATAKERFENVVFATFCLRDFNDHDVIWEESDADTWPEETESAEWYIRVMRWFEPALDARMVAAAFAEADRFSDAHYRACRDDDEAIYDLHRRYDSLIDPRFRHCEPGDFLPAVDLAKDHRLSRWGELTGRMIYCGGRSIEARFNSSPWLNPYFDLPRRERLSRYEKHISEMIPNAWRLATSLYGKLPALWRDGAPDEADVLHDLHAAAETERAVEKGGGTTELAKLRRARQPERKPVPTCVAKPICAPEPTAHQLDMFERGLE